MYDERVARSVEGVNTIYHEATYTESYFEKARARGHSTAAEAARIAKMAGAERLVLGHFSKRYHDESEHLKESQAIFPNTVIAYEGLKLDLI
jgi:ribonuclease Z